MLILHCILGIQQCSQHPHDGKSTILILLPHCLPSLNNSPKQPKCMPLHIVLQHHLRILHILEHCISQNVHTHINMHSSLTQFEHLLHQAQFHKLMHYFDLLFGDDGGYELKCGCYVEIGLEVIDELLMDTFVDNFVTYPGAISVPHFFHQLVQSVSLRGCLRNHLHLVRGGVG